MSAPLPWDGVPLHAADDRRWHWLRSPRGADFPAQWLPRSRQWEMHGNVEFCEDVAKAGYAYRGVCPWPDEPAKGGAA